MPLLSLDEENDYEGENHMKMDEGDGSVVY